MSYCRFSSMNWMSDVYVYEDVSGGWTTHVASRRRPISPLPDIMSSSLSRSITKWCGGAYDIHSFSVKYPDGWRRVLHSVWCRFLSFWHKHVHMGSLKLIPLRRIGLPFDGETFNDPTPKECAERLLWLCAMGYRVPMSAVDALQSEV